MAPDIVGVVDPLDEVGHSPVKNLVHNYPDKVAFCVTSECAVYCRYCLRKRMVGDADWMMKKDELRDGLAYLRATRRHPRRAADRRRPAGVLRRRTSTGCCPSCASIPHVEVIRLGSRLPVVNPMRITPELCDGAGANSTTRSG